MKVPHPLDDEALGALIEQQKRLAWHPINDISWEKGIDFSRPFVPLDSGNLFFKHVTKEEKKALSQYMGLMIAATFSEMEMTMQRFREASWRPFMERYSPNPEMIELGEEFFDEESKHAFVFQRYLDMAAAHLNTDPHDLKSILPQVKPGYVDALLRSNDRLSGMAMWWIVATVEEESTLIFKQMKNAERKLDPLYNMLHLRHFEEEARHASYPFMMLTLQDHVSAGAVSKIARQGDFLLAEVIKILWMFFELAKTVELKKWENHHPFFGHLWSLVKKLGVGDLPRLASGLMRETPYLSSFINPLFHPHTKKEMIRKNMLRLPMPDPVHLDLGWDS